MQTLAGFTNQKDRKLGISYASPLSSQIKGLVVVCSLYMGCWSNSVVGGGGGGMITLKDSNKESHV